MNAVSSMDVLYKIFSSANDSKEVDKIIQEYEMAKDLQAIEEKSKIMKQTDFRPQTFDQVIGQTEIKEF